ncbi:MAG: RDD family protein [Betaproteobacteria bacterium]|nr:RDD family protein [Betaproteobacteria bacterium]
MTASPARRLLSLLYEGLLLAAVLLVGALPFLVLAQDLGPALKRPLFQIYLVALAGIYFVWQWLEGGQTLPMKTWRIQLVTRDGAPLTPRHALARFAFALAGSLPLGAGFLWALVDRERLFLHDRLAGTRIISAPATISSSSPRQEKSRSA